MKNKLKSMLLLASAVLTLNSCSGQTGGCCGSKNSEGGCKKTSSTDKKQGKMTNETGTCAKCGKNSCDASCESNASTINSISEDVCTTKTARQIEQEAEAFKKMNAYKRISSVEELETGYEFVYENVDPELSMELADFLKLELRCCPTYDYALVVDAKTKTIHYQRFGSQQIKKELKEYLGMIGLLK